MGTGFISKLAAYDPLHKAAGALQASPVGKVLNYTDPIRNPVNPTQNLGQGLVDAGNRYSARNTVTQNPTPFAGVTPTLQDANAGYVQATQQVQQKMQQQPGMYGTQQPPQQRQPLNLWGSVSPYQGA